MRSQALAVSLLFAATVVNGFAGYSSLAGLSRREIEEFARRFPTVGAQPAPGPITDTSAKLVNDPLHPWKPLRPGDQRGPCPGLNTLASHGWIDRSGIDTPGNIVKAAMEGFNMDNDLAVFVAYAAFLVDGNQLTNLLSIGAKTPRTGPNPPPPAIVGGLDTHGVFEGDASMTRGDFFFGDNHSFNETLFQEFIDSSNESGGGFYNLTAAGTMRHRRVQDSIATNPNFTFVSPRYFTAYAESSFPFKFFVDGRINNDRLNLTVARGFFQNSQMPDGFFRRNGTFGLTAIGDVLAAIFELAPVLPGRNQGVGNYVLDPTSPDFNTPNTLCAIYTGFANGTVPMLYPDPTPELRKALNINLDNFFSPLSQDGCTKVFPFGM